MHCKILLLPLIFICCFWNSNAQVSLIADPVTTTQGQSFCLDVRVADFDQIVNIQFSMNWNINIIRFDSITNVNFPRPENFFANQNLAVTGSMPVIWIDPFGNGASVADGTSVFKICFTVVGNIGDCSTVSFVDLPLNMEASDVNSGGQDIGINPIQGKVCIVEPYSFPNTNIQNVNCAALGQGSINISPRGGVPPYTYSWSGPNGFTSDQEDITGLTDGIYTLTISDSSNPSFSATKEFTITGDYATPTANAGNGGEINCNKPVFQLNGIGSSMGGHISYQWSTSNGSIVSGANTLSPKVDSDGDYILTVTNNINGCTDESIVSITIDTLQPNAVASASNEIDCRNNSALLSGNGSSTGADFEYSWTTNNGQIIGAADMLNAAAGTAGEYILEVHNRNNGCVNQAFTLVATDTVAPLAEAGPAAQIDCTDPMLELDGNGSASGVGYSYLWTSTTGNIVAGAMSLTPTVDEAGTYYLAVTDSGNGCKSVDSVVVEKDDKLPAAVVSADTAITCQAKIIQLSGAGSAQSSGIIYQWTTTDGNILSDPNVIILSVDQAGTYQLLVTDTTNGCSADAQVVVEDHLPPDANAGTDQNSCNTSVELNANLVAGLTGSWMSDTQVFIADPTAAITQADDLQAGVNTFVWTLSTTECPAYDSDTLVIFVEGMPNAEDDQFGLPYNASAFPLNLVANDDSSQLSDWNIRLLSSPSSGSLNDLGAGVFAYSTAGQFAGTLEFEYELCNAVCVELCDSAKVLLKIAENLDTNVTVSNGITPNGDGMNDVFIIPELETAPEDFPNNELIIFNRWGDIIYKAAPYHNDFDGRGDNGQELPQGTYYYIMRLELSGNKIYRGDLTILK